MTHRNLDFLSVDSIYTKSNFTYNKFVTIQINEIVQNQDKRPFISTVIFNTKIKWLVDSGAAISVMDFDLFKSFHKLCSLSKTQFYGTIQSATGHLFQQMGTFDIPIKIGDIAITHPVVVVKDLNTRAILGWDFISHSRAQFDHDKNTILIPSAYKNCEVTNNFFSEFPISVSKKCHLKPMTLNHVKVCLQGNKSDLNICVKNVDSRHYVIECLQAVKSDQFFLLPIFNTSHEDIVLQRGECVATAEIVTNEDIYQLSELQICKKKSDSILTEEKKKMIQGVQIGGPEDFQDNLRQLLFNFHDVISQDKFDLGRTDVLPHNIRLDTDQPIHLKQFRIPWHHQECVEQFVQEMLQNGCIQASKSPYNAPIFCVKKPHGHGLRIVQDFRQLNLHTLQDKYSIREIQDCIDQIGIRKSKVFRHLTLLPVFGN